MFSIISYSAPSTASFSCFPGKNTGRIASAIVGGLIGAALGAGFGLTLGYAGSIVGSCMGFCVGAYFALIGFDDGYKKVDEAKKYPPSSNFLGSTINNATLGLTFGMGCCYTAQGLLKSNFPVSRMPNFTATAVVGAGISLAASSIGYKIGSLFRFFKTKSEHSHQKQEQKQKTHSKIQELTFEFKPKAKQNGKNR